ncbi:hypothetical protein OFQ54_04320 [Brachyspira hyodysenteriae]|uniref:hypothetical protein n=1 Tax=Brachyspira hyodysenteriae TaxID=159 RepID=UPI0022CD548E|nr:hypothetical protein [Brachyspira hyodysenteriae]MCZ9961049.1 hypothetical protein [Brachyspira hyodysenteriae]
MIKNKKIVKTLIFISLISIVSMFSISCSSFFEPDYRVRFRPYDLRGTWRNIDNYNERFTISYDGILTFYNSDGTYSRHYIDNWNYYKYDEGSYYELVIPNIPILGSIVFYFISENECEISYGSKPNMIFYYEKI